MCKEKGIQVSNAGGYSTNSVAELTFGLIIALLRSIVPLEAVVREEGTKDGYRQTDLKGKTLGVIGTGKIGGTVAELRSEERRVGKECRTEWWMENGKVRVELV